MSASALEFQRDLIRPGIPIERVVSGETCLFDELQLLQTYFTSQGFPLGLAENLHRLGITRSLEVGTGWQQSVASLQLAALAHEGVPLIEPGGAWIVEPDELSARAHVYRRIFNSTEYERLRYAPQLIEDFSKRVGRGDMLPFALVISKGVVSTGQLGPLADPVKMHDAISSIFGAMRDCLPPNDQAGIIVATSVLSNELIPLGTKQLKQLGLRVEYCEYGGDADWQEIMEMSIDDEFPPYNRVVLVRATT